MFLVILITISVYLKEYSAFGGSSSSMRINYQQLSSEFSRYSAIRTDLFYSFTSYFLDCGFLECFEIYEFTRTTDLL